MSGPHGHYLLTGHGNSYVVGERPQCAIPEAWKPSYSEEQVAELRAAVAELVEAANEGAQMPTTDGRAGLYFSPGKAERLFAALAAFGGGQ